MTCEEFQDQFVEHFLGELSAAEQHNIEEHLQGGCEACNREFRALHDATELLYTIAPQVELTQARRDAIFHNAVSSSWEANQVVPDVPIQAGCARKHDMRPGLGYGLLALVAGFVLVMLVPAAARRSSPSQSLTQQQFVYALEGEREELASKLKFVSFKEVSANDASHRQQPDSQPQLLGFLLVDARAREIHLLGRLEETGLTDVPKFELSIITASERVVHPLKIDLQGSCRALVPLPAEPILSIELRSQARKSTDTVS